MCSSEDKRAEADVGTISAAVGPAEVTSAAGRKHRRSRRPRTQIPVEQDDFPRRSAGETMEIRARRANVDEAVDQDNKNTKNRSKLLIGLAVLGLVVAVIVDLSCHHHVRNWLDGAFGWIEDNPEAGVVVFALIFCLATLIFIPGLLLTIGAGVAFGRALGFGFGLLWGSVAVLAGAFAACVIAFYVGRYVLHEQAQRCASRYRILGAVNTAIERNGIKVMFLLRLSPVVPFSGFNIIAGVTKASFRDYMIGCLGVIPGTVAFVFIGVSTAGTMGEEQRMRDGEADKTECIIRMTLLIVGVCAAVLALIAVTVYARRALKEALLEAELEEKNEAVAAETDLESGSGEEFKEALTTIALDGDGDGERRGPT